MIRQTVKWRVQLKCRKHPRFDGTEPGKVRGNCKACQALVEARAQLRATDEQVKTEIYSLMAKAQAAGCFTPGFVGAGQNAPNT